MQPTFNWYSLVGMGDHGHSHIAGAALVFIIVTLVSLMGRFLLIKRGGDLVPDEGITAYSIIEVAIDGISSFFKGILDHGNDIYLPFLVSLFFYILISNLLGLLPGFLPPTENLNTTFALGVSSFLVYNAIGISKHKFGYIKQFMGPVVWLAPFMFFIELVSHLVRPFSLALRLKGNISGDHLVYALSLSVPYLVPLFAMCLGLFVACIQALVFIMLSMIYINLATADEH